MPLDVEQVLFQINTELQKLGIQYLGDDPQRAGDILRSEMALRDGLPACYQRNFDPHDMTCRRCDLWKRCGDGVTYARVDLTAPPQQMTACRLCDGDLMIELFDGDGHIQDLACTTAGCKQTLNRQRKQQESDG